jgi:hypothetical protein
MNQEILYQRPFQGNMGNNRRMTLCRRKQAIKIQSVPVYEKDGFGRVIKILGYKHIQH